MQEQEAPPPPPTPTPPLPPLPATPQATTVQTSDFRALSREEVAAIRARREELSNQLTSAASRREELVAELRSMPAAAQTGVLERIAVLDKRLVQLETDIAETGRILTSAGGLPGGTIQIPGDRFQMGNEQVGKVATVFTIFVLAPLAFAIARAVWRRSNAPRHPVRDPEVEGRMERLEQAVDAIAIEVERVGEAQRYQARLLTEAQLMPAVGVGQRAAEPVRVGQYESLRERES
jgi:hypothetical protein